MLYNNGDFHWRYLHDEHDEDEALALIPLGNIPENVPRYRCLQTNHIELDIEPIQQVEYRDQTSD